MLSKLLQEDLKYQLFHQHQHFVKSYETIKTILLPYDIEKSFLFILEFHHFCSKFQLGVYFFFHI
jgi:hypothetical protein